MFYGYIVNMVLVNLTEYTSHMSHDTVLSAVINHIIADDMGTDGFLAPSDLAGTEYRFHLVLITWFTMGSGTEIMSGGCFFSNTDSTAFCIMNRIILDDPALAPIYTQKSRLICGRGRPWTGCLCHLKSPDRNIISSGFCRIKTASAHIDFHQFRVWISPLEICINSRIVIIHLGIPLI